jgi:hypothetical protein
VLGSEPVCPHQLGDGSAVTSDNLVGSAAPAEEVFGFSCLAPRTGLIIRGLADLNPTTLAVMHGSCFAGYGQQRSAHWPKDTTAAWRQPSPDPSPGSDLVRTYLVY